VESEGRFISEYMPYNNINFQSLLPQNELRNYSLPVDARNARSGSVVYGSKELVRAMVGSWQESADHQRSSDNQRRHLHHRFISNRAGVILQSQVRILTKFLFHCHSLFIMLHMLWYTDVWSDDVV